MSRNVEANGQIAKRLGDNVFLTDEEMYGAVCMLCKKDYSVASPLLLSPDAKLSVAKTMRFNYNASTKQIKRILKLELSVLNELFAIGT